MDDIARGILQAFGLSAVGTSTSTKTETAGKLYRVYEQKGAFKSKANAEALQKKLQKEGKTAIIIQQSLPNQLTPFGADKTMTAVISGEADIGFMGSEASIYTYNEGANDYVVNFAQLTQRAGNFLVARDNEPDFKWEDLKGKNVIGGRKGGMPEMVFEYILRQNGIEPSEVNIDQSIDFGSTAAAFAGDQSKYDYTVEFEPSATALETEGKGYVVASLGTDSGYVPYTAFSAKKSYLDQNPEVIQGFVNALQKGMDYVQSHSPEEIAKVIAPQFDETDLETITKIVTRYYEQDTQKADLVFEEDSFNLLQDILEDAGELAERAPYKDLVTKEFAEKAIQ